MSGSRKMRKQPLYQSPEGTECKQLRDQEKLNQQFHWFKRLHTD